MIRSPRARARPALALAALAPAALAPARRAGAREMPLARLPEASIVALAPVLKQAELALVESEPDGRMKQVTLMAWVAAPPETVRAVLGDPGAYKTFFPNVSRSDWTPAPGGGAGGAPAGTVRWRLDLPISSFEQVNTYRFEPGETGAVLVGCPDVRDDATYRWEFLRAGAGTVLVQYGYTDVKHSNALVRSFIKRMAASEHGLALAAQRMLLSAMKHEAERRARLPIVREPAAPIGDPARTFGFLLPRGQVVLIHSRPSGRLAEVTLMDRAFAPAAELKAVLARPGEWRRFVPGLSESEELLRRGDELHVRHRFAIPLASWSTRYALRIGEDTVEGAGVEGDLRGAVFRWHLQARGPRETLVTYRVSQRFDASSLVFRKLIQLDPSLEHGLNVAFDLVYLLAVRGRAERWPGYTN